MGTKVEFSETYYDSSDYCIDDHSIPTKEDAIPWLEWQIDILKWDTKV